MASKKVVGLASGLMGAGGLTNTAPLKFGDAGPSSASQKSDIANRFTGGVVNFGSTTAIPIFPIVVLGVLAFGGWYVISKK